MDETRHGGDEVNREDETVMDEAQGSSTLQRQSRAAQAAWLTCSQVLSHIISQLRPGADLSRVTLPTFILEPRSMLERITKCVGADTPTRNDRG